MNDKWWDGLSPESKARFQGTQAALRREIQIRDDRIEELEKENFTLAATQCPFPDGEGLTGASSGYSYCAKDAELEGCDEYIQSLIKTIEEADEQIEELETKLEAAEKIGFDECSSRYGITSYDDWWQDRYKSLSRTQRRTKMNGNLIISMVAAFILSILISGFVGMHMQEWYEHNLKVACINAGKGLVEGSCMAGETK